MPEDTELSDTEAEDESLEDVSAALESTGFAPEDDAAEAEADTSEDESEGLPGPLGALESLQGTGKDIESYEGSPIASAIGPEGSKGALHIARGIDGLSPLGAMNPVMDIFIGIILLTIEGNAEEDSTTEDFEVEDDPTSAGYARRNGGGDYSELT